MYSLFQTVTLCLYFARAHNLEASGYSTLA